jgi:hypothetical protein
VLREPDELFSPSRRSIVRKARAYLVDNTAGGCGLSRLEFVDGLADAHCAISRGA